MKRSDITNKNFKDVLTTTIQKLHETQPLYNANVTICEIEPQLQSLMTQSESLPLYGVGIAVKDNFNTKGIKTTASSAILDNYYPVYDATVIEKLKKAGAIIVSKTSMDELGMGGTNINAHTGRTYHPYDRSRITGGSSGGSAALVAAGIVPMALGTDTGDSIRKPAAYCGIVGFKPTYGRISRYGVIPYASSLDHVGFFTTTLKDSALLLEICAGRDHLDATSLFDEVPKYSELGSNIKGKKIGILKNVQDLVTDSTMKQRFNALIEHLKKAGAIIEEIELNNDLMRVILPTYLIIANAEASANHSNLDGIKFGQQQKGNNLEEIMINTRTLGFSRNVRTRFLIGAYSLDSDNQENVFKRAQKVRRLIVENLKQKMQGYDAIINLATSSVAPSPEEVLKQASNDDVSLIVENNMILGNFSGFPSVSIPLGFKDELPYAITLMSHSKREDILFEIGYEIELFTQLAGKVKGE